MRIDYNRSLSISDSRSHVFQQLHDFVHAQSPGTRFQHFLINNFASSQWRLSRRRLAHCLQQRLFEPDVERETTEVRRRGIPRIKRRSRTSMPNVMSKERSGIEGHVRWGSNYVFVVVVIFFASVAPSTVLHSKNVIDCCVVTMPVICATLAHPTSHILRLIRSIKRCATSVVCDFQFV